jgi:hypothetical protein
MPPAKRPTKIGNPSAAPDAAAAKFVKGPKAPAAKAAADVPRTRLTADIPTLLHTALKRAALLSDPPREMREVLAEALEAHPDIKRVLAELTKKK